MQGKTHVATVLAGALVIGPPPLAPAPWIALIIGALAPDIDGHGQIAHVGGFMPRIVPRPIRQLADAIGLALSGAIQHVFGHRGAFHWPIWYVGLFLLGRHLALPWLAWLGLGCLAHLAGDVLTVSGLPLFGPLFPKRHTSLFPMKTGSALEAVFGLGVWSFIGWRLWQLTDGGTMIAPLLRRMAHDTWRYLGY